MAVEKRTNEPVNGQGISETFVTRGLAPTLRRLPFDPHIIVDLCFFFHDQVGPRHVHIRMERRGEIQIIVRCTAYCNKDKGSESTDWRGDVDLLPNQISEPRIPLVGRSRSPQINTIHLLPSLSLSLSPYPSSPVPA